MDKPPTKDDTKMDNMHIIVHFTDYRRCFLKIDQNVYAKLKFNLQNRPRSPNIAVGTGYTDITYTRYVFSITYTPVRF